MAIMRVQAPSKRRWALPAAMLAVGLALRLALAWQDHRVLLAEYLWYDDSFLALSIAHNLAHGHGMTSDGVHVTNGFQPLYVFFLVPILALIREDNLILPIHVSATLLAFAGIGAAVLWYLTARRLFSRPAALAVLFFFCLSTYFVAVEINGLETAVFGLTLSATVYYYITRFHDPAPPPSTGRCAILGLLGGLTILARIDAAIFVHFMVLDYLWKRRQEFGAAARRAVVGTAACLLTMAPWLIASLALCGSIMPVSGPAVRYLSTRMGFRVVGNYVGYRGPETFTPETIPPAYYANNLLHLTSQTLALLPITAHGQGVMSSYVARYSLRFPVGRMLGAYPRTSLVTLGAVVVLAVLIPYIRRGRKTADQNPPREWGASGANGGVVRCSNGRIANAGLGPVLFVRFPILCWLAAYAFYVFGLWHTHRYIYPILALLTLLSGGLIDTFVRAIGERRRRLVPMVMAPAAVMYLFLFVTQAGHYYTARPETVTPDPYTGVLPWVERHIPRSALLGAFQSGTLSYFLPQTCINLDGVVNADALRAVQADDVWGYIDAQGAEYIVDWPVNIELYLTPMGAADSPRLTRLYDEHEMAVYRIHPHEPFRATPEPAGPAAGGR